jgi:hypothetical protein
LLIKQFLEKKNMEQGLAQVVYEVVLCKKWTLEEF